MCELDDPVALAEQLATRWHAGQTDKLGEPYIGHPRRVAARLTTADQKVVALLHDVLEDTRATREDLTAAGFPPDVIAAIDALTRRPAETEHDYLSRVCRSPLAITVKRADIADNRDPQRIARLPDPALRHRLEQKYDHALTLLDRLARGTAEKTGRGGGG